MPNEETKPQRQVNCQLRMRPQKTCNPLHNTTVLFEKITQRERDLFWREREICDHASGGRVVAVFYNNSILKSYGISSALIVQNAIVMGK